jgi:DNA-binding NarL/FixJ family response regulator
MNNSRPIRVLSIDDHPLLSEGISTLINSQSDMELVGSAFTGADGIAKFRELRPDIALMDLRLPDLSGIEVLAANYVCRGF